MGRGLGEVQRRVLALAYVNHRDTPWSETVRHIRGPEDGPPLRRAGCAPYPYMQVHELHLTYSEVLGWALGLAAFWHPVAEVFLPPEEKEGRYASARVTATRAMWALQRRGLAIYRDWARPTGICLEPAGVELGARLIREGVPVDDYLAARRIEDDDLPPSPLSPRKPERRVRRWMVFPTDDRVPPRPILMDCRFVTVETTAVTALEGVT